MSATGDGGCCILACSAGAVLLNALFCRCAALQLVPSDINVHACCICAAHVLLQQPADNALLCRPHPCRYGIEGTLDEMFEAPAVIKSVLGDLAGINTCYVGNASTSECIERVGGQSTGPCCMTPACCVLSLAHAEACTSLLRLALSARWYAQAARAATGVTMQERVPAQDASQIELTLLPPCVPARLISKPMAKCRTAPARCPRPCR